MVKLDILWVDFIVIGQHIFFVWRYLKKKQVPVIKFIGLIKSRYGYLRDHLVLIVIKHLWTSLCLY